jgi:hypothetical protein
VDIDRLAKIAAINLVAGAGADALLLAAGYVITTRVTRRPTRYLIRHIVEIALSYICMAAVTLDSIWTKINEPISWRWWVATLGGALGIDALRNMRKNLAEEGTKPGIVRTILEDHAPEQLGQPYRGEDRREPPTIRSSEPGDD